MSKGEEKARVLIVEDEMIQMLLLKRFYETLHCEVVGTATSAEEAIKIAMEQKPEIISMDIFLEGEKDGIQAAEEICMEEKIPVIYITGNSDDFHYQRALKTGFTAYLSKPVSLDELRSAVEKAVQSHSAT